MRKNGKGVEIGRTVETLVIFSALNEKNSYDIIKFLLEHTDSKKGSPIPGSWNDPDIRVSQGFKDTEVMQELVGSDLFRNVVSNVLGTEQEKLVVLRLSAKFDEDAKKRIEGWTFLETPVNKDLAQYISDFDVRP